MVIANHAGHLFRKVYHSNITTQESDKTYTKPNTNC